MLSKRWYTRIIAGKAVCSFLFFIHFTPCCADDITKIFIDTPSDNTNDTTKIKIITHDFFSSLQAGDVDGVTGMFAPEHGPDAKIIRRSKSLLRKLIKAYGACKKNVNVNEIVFKKNKAFVTCYAADVERDAPERTYQLTLNNVSGKWLIISTSDLKKMFLK